MNIRTLKKVLPVLFSHNIVPFLWGNQGIGKTQSVGQLAKELGYGFVHLNFATQEVGDLVGLLDKRPDGTVAHLRPNWMPTDEDGPHIIFMDELNRSHPDVIQALFSLITERRIHQHKLGKECYLVAAGNYNNEKFTVTDTSDQAWNSRFCHLDVTPSVEEWLDYMSDKHGTKASDVLDFIRELPSNLEGSSKASSTLDTNFLRPDRRSWESIIKLDCEERLSEGVKFEVFQGLVGTASAASFLSHKENKEKAVNLDDILLRFDKGVKERLDKLVNKAVSTEVRFDIYSQPVNELLEKATTKPKYLLENVHNLIKFLEHMPSEMAVNVLTKLGSLSQDQVKEDDLDIVRELKDNTVNNAELLSKVLLNKEKEAEQVLPKKRGRPRKVV
jgi:MoxR-like ATPase